MPHIPTVIVIGAGSRGTTYAGCIAELGGRAKVIAVAEPIETRRRALAEKHGIPADMQFTTWEEVARLPKFADAVMVCTMDALHEAPAIAFAKLNYHLLLEKPMAPDPGSCTRIAAAVKEAGIMCAVCHVNRYTQYTRQLKEIIGSGALGDIVSIQHLEPVGTAHYAHSFTRGNWRNEKESSFMLLQKCCHDVDWLRYIMGKHCTGVQSFGSLHYFKAANKPAGAADRCLDCAAHVEETCPFSAKHIYIDGAKTGLGWLLGAVTTDHTEEGITAALREGPYGRCVFACDNDVVDHQVVNMLFADGTTAAMTMTAFSNAGGRQTRIFGTKGEINGDSRHIHIGDHLTGKWTVVDTEIDNDGGIGTGHGGGDFGIVEAFVSALEHNDPSRISSGIDETLESHLIVFAAERSRHANTVCGV